MVDPLEEITRAFRGSLASLRAAAETLELFPQMEEEQQRRLRGVVLSEARRLGEWVDRLEAVSRQDWPYRATGEAPPTRRRLAADELARAVGESAGALGFSIDLEGQAEAFADVELESLVEASAAFLLALRRDFAVSALILRHRVLDGHLVFDWVWSADEPHRERLRTWQSEALERAPTATVALRPLLRRHGGEAWLNVDRERNRAYLRLLLPLAPP